MTFDGGNSSGDKDSLAVTGTSAPQVVRETYLVGSTADAGIWLLDADGNMGPGVSGNPNGDELTINFTNLESVDTDVPTLNFDVIMNAAANNASIANGGSLNGFNSLQTTDNNSTFETFRFANKLHVRIMGQNGADTVSVNFTTPSSLLTTLELDGNVADGVMGQPADDSAIDTLSVLQDPSGIGITLAGQGGNDVFSVGDGDLSKIKSSVSIVGGGSVGGIGEKDSLKVDDSARTVPEDYVINPPDAAAPTIFTCNTTVNPPTRTAIVTFDNTLEQATLLGTNGVDPTSDINRFDVTPSDATTFNIDGGEPHALLGDYLSIRFAGTKTRKLAFTDRSTGTGAWTMTNIASGKPETVNFTHLERFNFFPVLVYGADAAKNGKPTVKVVDADTDELVTSFLAYEANYTQGVRVALGDVTGDGIPEIVTAPGHNHSPQIKFFDVLSGSELAGTSFLAYPASYKGGAMVALGDVNNDHLNDLVVAPSRGKAEIHTYINMFATTPATPFDTVHQLDFLAFKRAFIGGATVAVGDVEGDASAEIIVGSGGGMRDTVNIFSGVTSAPVTFVTRSLQTILPFAIKQRGGANVALVNVAAGAKLRILIGSGVGGASQAAVYDVSNLTAPVNTFFSIFTGNGSNAPLRVAAVAKYDSVGTLTPDILLAQGPDGKSQRVLHGPPGGPLVDLVLSENDVEFRDGFYVAADINAIAPFFC